MSHLAPIHVKALTTRTVNVPENQEQPLEVGEIIPLKRKLTTSSSNRKAAMSKLKIKSNKSLKDLLSSSVTATAAATTTKKSSFIMPTKQKGTSKRRSGDFILRSAPKHFNHWTNEHLKQILREKIEGRSKRRCNRNSNALKFLGGAAKNGINARQLRRRCLRMALPLTKKQSEDLFASIATAKPLTHSSSSNAISLHQFLLGLFPDDYETHLTHDFSKQQTLMGLSEIDRAGKNGKEWNVKKVYPINTMRWAPSSILVRTILSYLSFLIFSINCVIITIIVVAVPYIYIYR